MGVVVERQRRPRKARRVIVPIALTVTVLAGAAAITTSTLAGCGDDGPTDAGVDTMPDTPII